MKGGEEVWKCKQYEESWKFLTMWSTGKFLITKHLAWAVGFLERQGVFKRSLKCSFCMNVFMNLVYTCKSGINESDPYQRVIRV